MATQLTLQKVLERAIQKEIEAQRLYSELSQKAKDTVARDALRDMTKPMGVATYRVLPRKLKDEFPTARQIEKGIGIREELEERAAGHDEQIAAIFDAIRWLMAPPDAPPRRCGTGFRGCPAAWRRCPAMVLLYISAAGNGAPFRYEDGAGHHPPVYADPVERLLILRALCQY